MLIETNRLIIRDIEADDECAFIQKLECDFKLKTFANSSFDLTTFENYILRTDCNKTEDGLNLFYG